LCPFGVSVRFETVTVKGVVANAKAHNLREDAKTATTDAGVKKTDNEHGHLE